MLAGNAAGSSTRFEHTFVCSQIRARLDCDLELLPWEFSIPVALPQLLCHQHQPISQSLGLVHAHKHLLVQVKKINEAHYLSCNIALFLSPSE